MTSHNYTYNNQNTSNDTEQLINIYNFLNNIGIVYFSIQPLQQDASSRRYFRIQTTKKSYVLMDSTLNIEAFNQFIAVSTYVKAYGFMVPQIYNVQQNGYALLEDLGSQSINQYLDSIPTQSIEAEYQYIIDLLIQWQQMPIPTTLSLPHYDSNNLNTELQQFLKHYAIHYIPNQQYHDAADELVAIFTDLYKNIYNNYTVIVHKDFHVDNLMMFNDNKKIGILDFQDACIGSPAYDLVSLLQDARRFIPPQLEQRLLQYYLSKTTHDIKKFTYTYNLLGLQKNLKIIGIFHRIYKEKQIARYLQYCPSVWKYIIQCLKKSEFTNIMNWMQNYNIPLK